MNVRELDLIRNIRELKRVLLLILKTGRDPRAAHLLTLLQLWQGILLREPSGDTVSDIAGKLRALRMEVARMQAIWETQNRKRPA